MERDYGRLVRHSSSPPLQDPPRSLWEALGSGGGASWPRATSVGGGRLSKTTALTLDLPGA